MSVTLNANRSGLNFNAGYLTSIGAGASSLNALSRNGGFKRLQRAAP